MEIAGKVALVTGAAAGIGLAAAQALAREGARVVVADVDEASGRAAAGELGGTFVRADVAVDDEVRAMIAAAPALEILVNNAGGVWGESYPEAPVERWAHVLDVNLRGTMLATQLAVAAMRGRGGAIVNVSSVAGVGTRPHGAPEYAAAKAAVNRLTTALAPLAESDGIRVNAICPDYVDTPAVRAGLERMTSEQRVEVPPLVPPERVADAILDLIRDDSLAGRVLLAWAHEDWYLLPRDRRD